MTNQQLLALSPNQRVAALIEAVQQGFAKNSPLMSVAVGTAYAVTNAAAALVFGTTSPVLVLPAGTHLLLPNVDLDATGATVVAETATLKVRRTNNTAADVANSSLTIDLPVMTTLTQTLGRFSLGPLIYSTTNPDDSLTIFGNVSATLGAGHISATGARIVAIQLY